MKHSFIKSGYLLGSAQIITLAYLLVMFFFTPLYKFLEIYYFYPKINLSILRLGILLIAILLTVSLIAIKNYKFNLDKKILSNLITSILCITWVIIVILIYYPFIGSYSHNANELYLLRVDAVITGYCMMFFCGIFYDTKLIQNAMKVAWLLFTFFIIYNYEYLVESFFTYKLIKSINYMLLADAYVFLALLILFDIKSKIWTAFVFLTTVSVLFVLPSRTTFLCFIIGALFTFMISNIKTFIKNALFLTIVLAGLVFNFGFEVENNIFFKSSRIINTDFETDGSLNERALQLDLNFETFKSNWLLGGFMSDIKTFHGADGNYSHSYFSFWEQFGLIPFVLLLISVAILLRFLFLLRRNKSHIYLSSLSLTVFTLIAITFSRSFHNSFIWFIIPRVIIFYYDNKKKLPI
jgi:hypothetical protein